MEYEIEIGGVDAFHLFLAHNPDFIKSVIGENGNAVTVSDTREEIAIWLRKLRKARVRFSGVIPAQA
jgi:hypothetical protein